MSPAQLRDLVARDDLRSPHPDVFVVAGSPATEQQRLWVAYLAVGEPCAFSGITAGWQHGFPGCPAPALPRLVVPGYRRPRTDHAVVRRVAWWDEAVVERCPEGLPRLCARDVVLTAAPELSPTALLAVVQHAVFTRQVTTDDLRAQLRRGLPGGVRLGAVLDVFERGHDSAPEAEVYRTLRGAGVAPDHCNVSVRTPDGTTVGPFDGYFECGVAYEYDGRESHNSAAASARDSRKSRLAAAIQLRVVRLDNSHRRDPNRLVRRIREATTAATHRSDLAVVHRGDRACVCGWAPGTAR